MRVHPACSILRQTVSALTHQSIPPASRMTSTNQGCWASRPEGVGYLPSWLHQDARTSPCLGSGIPLPGISSSSQTTWSVANSQTEPGVALIKRDRQHWPRVACDTGWAVSCSSQALAGEVPALELLMWNAVLCFSLEGALGWEGRGSHLMLTS